MEFTITTQADLDFALLTAKANDDIMMPEAMYEENKFKIRDKAIKLKCNDKYYRFPNIYLSKNPAGVQIKFYPLPDKTNNNKVR